MHTQAGAQTPHTQTHRETHVHTGHTHTPQGLQASLFRTRPHFRCAYFPLVLCERLWAEQRG